MEGPLLLRILLTSAAVYCGAEYQPDYFLTPTSCESPPSHHSEFLAVVSKAVCPVFHLDTSELSNQTFHSNSSFEEGPPEVAPVRYKCNETFMGDLGFLPTVHIMNASLLLDILNRNASENSCVLVDFYSPSCPFSARLAPYYNAMPRTFPTLLAVGVDASTNTRLNTKYAILGTPTVLLFYQGKPVARFNSSEYSYVALKGFVTKYTDVNTTETSEELEDQDYFGTLSTKPIVRRDPYLLAAWAFILICGGYYTSRLPLIQRLVELLARNWREANEEN